MATERTVLVRLKANPNDFIRGVAAATAATKGLLDSVDKTNDRTAWLAQGILALAPAAAPIGAAVVPAVVGLSTQLGIAAGAAGVAAIAFNGVGDGLKALNKYQLAPTAENMAKLQVEMEKLGPAGQDFLFYLDSLSDELKSVRDEAREDMFPGVTKGIDHLMGRLPQVRRIIGEMAEGMGQLANEGGAALGGARFNAFFDYLDREARPILVDMGHTMGNFIDGLAEMFVAFEPLTMRFSKGFLSMSRDFADWAHGLDENQSFQDFLAYVERSGPPVLDLVGSMTDVFVQLVEALAPIGDVVVPMLTDFLDVLGEVIDTPLGTAFLGLAAAMSVYGRAAALASITTSGMFANLKNIPLIAGATGAFKAGTPSISMWGTAMFRAGQAAKYQNAQTRVANAAVGRYVRAMAPAAAAIGGVALAMSDVDDKMGLTNTTMLGLMGLMAGPWGAAAGVAAGFASDVAASNNDAADALDRLNDGLGRTPHELDANSAALDEARAKVDAFRDAITPDSGGLGGTIKTLFSSLAPYQNGFEEIFGTSEIDELEGKLKRLEAQVQANFYAASRLSVAFDGWSPKTASLSDLEGVLSKAQPAMEALGITLEDIGNADPRTFNDYVSAIRSWNRQTDSLPGRTKRLAEAMADLQDDMVSTADSADALATALEDLLGPGLDAEAAFDAYGEAVGKLRKELKDVDGPFRGFGKAAIENRAITRDAAEATIEMLAAQAKAGASSKELARLMKNARADFIAEGVAAGIDADVMERRANAIGLTPRLIRTVLNAVDNASPKVDRLKDKLRGLQNKTITITTVHRQVGTGGATYDQHVASGSHTGGRYADGAVVDYYAKGGLRENHVAQIAPAGSWRVWAEPETGGEAYIPLAASKRDRSRVIADEVVSRLGGQVDWFANGGLLEQAYRGAMQTATPTLSLPSSLNARFSDGDLALLGKILRNAAPIYGQAHFHGDGSAEREARQRKAMGGF